MSQWTFGSMGSHRVTLAPWFHDTPKCHKCLQGSMRPHSVTMDPWFAGASQCVKDPNIPWIPQCQFSPLGSTRPSNVTVVSMIP